MSRPTTLFSTSVLAGVILLAAPATLSARTPADEDPFIGTAARYEALVAKLSDDTTPIQSDTEARIAADAISAAYFSERYADGAQLFARYQSAGLDPVAVAAGYGSTLLAGGNEALRTAARSELARIGARDAGDAPLAPALSQAALGADAMQRDDLPAAIEFFRAARDLARRDLAADNPVQVLFAVNYARHLQFSDREAGRLAAEASEKLAIEILPEGHPHWISVWYDMAARAMSANRHEDAATLYARITDLAVQEWGENDVRLYPILQYRAIALSGLGRRKEALELARMAISVEQGKPAGDRAMHRELIGGLLLGEGLVAEAVASYREGLDLLEGTDADDLRWGFIQSRLASALSLQGYDAEALSLAELAAAAFASKLPATHPGRVRTEGMIARAQARSGAPERAFALLESSAGSNEAKLLDKYAIAQDVGTIASNANTLFRDFAWVALKNGKLEEAWRAAQLTTLGELALSTAHFSYPGDRDGFGVALEAVRVARREEASIRNRLAEGAVAAEDLSAAIARREAAERDLDIRYPDHARYLRPSPTTLSQAKASLGEHEAIVIPLVVDDRNVTIALTSDGANWAETHSSYNSTIGLIRRLRESLEEGQLVDADADEFDSAAAHEIYRRFFPPAIEQALAGKTKLVFPAGGPLAQIPPSVLMSRLPHANQSGRFLIEDYAIAIRSSFQPLAKAGRLAEEGFAGVGAPLLATSGPKSVSLRGMAIDTEDLRSLPSLPGSQIELEVMLGVFAGQKTLLLTGAEATEPRVRSTNLEQYRVLAFSTHGLVGSQIPALGEPALVLTPPDSASPGNDGLLTASEIAELKLAADWVILSACNTAAGSDQGGSTYSGLARGFQLAGARSLLLSHWPLRDDAAAFLSVETVRRAEASIDRAHALREAQLEMLYGRTGMVRETSPAVWAPFVLIES